MYRHIVHSQFCPLLGISGQYREVTDTRCGDPPYLDLLDTPNFLGGWMFKNWGYVIYGDAMENNHRVDGKILGIF